MLARLPRPSTPMHLSERKLAVWAAWMRNAQRLIATLALAEIGRWTLSSASKSARPAAAGAGVPAPAAATDRFGDKLKDFSERTRADVRQRIHVLKCIGVGLGVAIVISSLSMLFLPGWFELLRDSWQWLEPVLGILSIAPLLLIGLFALAGFRPQWHNLRDRIEERLVERLVTRRLRRAHVLEP